MEKSEIFKKIGVIIAELNDQYQYLSAKPENLNDLELELFLANSNFLTDHIAILRKLNGVALARTSEPVPVQNNLPADEKEKQEEQPAGKPVEQEQSSEEEAKDVVQAEREEISEEDNSGITGQAETAAAGEESEAVADEEEEEAGLNEDTQPVPAADADEVVTEVVIPEKTISVETPAAPEEPVPVPTVNEMISARLNPSTVVKQFTRQSVTDLKAIISLNDKLLFIKDLFNGYSLAYSEAIELLNRFDSFEAADNFLKTNYASKNNWAEKQTTADKFYELLNRRFAK